MRSRTLSHCRQCSDRSPLPLHDVPTCERRTCRRLGHVPGGSGFLPERSSRAVSGLARRDSRILWALRHADLLRRGLHTRPNRHHDRKPGQPQCGRSNFSLLVFQASGVDAFWRCTAEAFGVPSDHGVGANACRNPQRVSIDQPTGRAGASASQRGIGLGRFGRSTFSDGKAGDSTATSRFILRGRGR